MPPPTIADVKLNLSEAEVDILDIVAPQHKRLRKEKRQRNDAASKPTPQATSSQPSPPPAAEVEKVQVDIVYR